MKKTILVMGLGKVGLLVAEMLDKYLPQFDVWGVDQPWSNGLEFWRNRGKLGTAVNIANLNNHSSEWGWLFDNCWAVVSCLPYHLNLRVAQAANSFGVNYFDLTEDVETTKGIMELSPEFDVTGLQFDNIRVPQCGLAPGFIGMLGAYLVGTDPRLNELSLMVGALPKHPKGELGYACNWSPEGLVNEYLNAAETLNEFERVTVSSLRQKSKVNIEGVDLEAFETSGGLGTMCHTFYGKLRNLTYKTLRYPGHVDMIRFLVHELGLGLKPHLLGELLVNACPPDPDDLVFVRACAHNENSWGLPIPIGYAYKMYARIYTPKELFGVTRTAIAWTTAAGVCGVVELAAEEGSLKPGFVNVELIPLHSFARTQSGKLFELEALLNERETA